MPISAPTAPAPGADLAPTITQRRWALYTLFFLPGLTMSSWVTRTPAIRDLLEATPAKMGLVLFGLSVGSMLGIIFSGKLVARFAARPVIQAGSSAVIISMPLIGISAHFQLEWCVAAGLFIFGAGMGSAEVGMNVEGAEVERITKKPFLASLHGFFSLGTVIGASLGIVFTSLAFPVIWHLVLSGLLSLALFLYVNRYLPQGTGKIDTHRQDGEVPQRTARLWLDPRLLLIGFIVLAMALAEGSANDWLPLVMVDGHGFDPAAGSLIFTGFALAMTIGRFCGGWFIARFGASRTFAVSAFLGASGLSGVIFLENPVLAGSAVILWGIGTSLAFPLAISAAGASGNDPAGRVAVAATIGYIAFLVGPPLLGFVGDEFGLRQALILPLGFVIVAMLLSSAVSERKIKIERVHSEAVEDSDPRH
ncbi:MFS transporter [Arthrobacter sp. MYb211]|nr:MFS transporter [Arthrobacter sp. MYb221]PRC06354.1 MFS transporter [Arthrobacter sp. MYb211]